MNKSICGNFANRMLSNMCKYCISKLIERSRASTCDTIFNMRNLKIKLYTFYIEIKYYVHPIRTELITANDVSPGVPICKIFKLSTAPLNRNGTQTFNTLAPPNKPNETITLKKFKFKNKFNVHFN